MFEGYRILNSGEIPSTHIGEALARKAFLHSRTKDWKTINVVAHAIKGAAQHNASAMSESPGASSQTLTEALYSLKETMFPELGIEKDTKADRVKAIMDKVPDAIKITPVGEGQRSGGR